MGINTGAVTARRRSRKIHRPVGAYEIVRA
jgi:hypothetical protein